VAGIITYEARLSGVAGQFEFVASADPSRFAGSASPGSLHIFEVGKPQLIVDAWRASTVQRARGLRGVTGAESSLDKFLSNECVPGAWPSYRSSQKR